MIVAEDWPLLWFVSYSRCALFFVFYAFECHRVYRGHMVLESLRLQGPAMQGKGKRRSRAPPPSADASRTTGRAADRHTPYAAPSVHRKASQRFATQWEVQQQ